MHDHAGTDLSRRSLFKLAAAAAAAPVALGQSSPLLAAAADTSDLTVEKVNAAVDRAVEFLKTKQQPEGDWPDRAKYKGGLAPLCTLAMLNAGYAVDDQAVAKSLAFQRKFNAVSTYCTSLQTMVFCAAEPKRDRSLIQRNVRWLEKRQITEGPEAGMWAIPNSATGDHTDNSMTHLAILALYEAERAGVKVNDKVWRLTKKYWEASQNGDGSWGWGPSYPGSGSMTCAGIACLIITAGELGVIDATAHGDKVQCCQPQASSTPLDNAFGWLERNFSVTHNPGSRYWLCYYLYALERAGRMSARRFIGEHDWYREGAAMLMQAQLFSGAWPSDLDFDEHEADPCVSTAFALMFLAKGRRPVVIAQLRHEPRADWNRHRSAVFNLLTAVEAAWHRDLTYQVVDIEHASVEDLLEAPVVFISGRLALQFTPEQELKLRQYVDRGGFIFAQQCCGETEFDVSFRKLMQKLFPEKESQLKLLPPSHPAWFAEERVDPQHLPQLWGIDVSCRTGVIYCPSDLSCLWELGRSGREAGYSEAVRSQVKAAKAVGVNVISYATNREVKYKDPVATSPTSTDRMEMDRGRPQVANILHPGGCAAAPGALSNLLKLVSHRLKIPLGEEPRDVALTDPTLFRHPLIFMHGRTSFTLTPAERKQLRTYLERGGMLFADSVCSSATFTESFRQEMKVILPDHPLGRIPDKSPIYSSEFGGEKIGEVTIRKAYNPMATDPARPDVIKGAPQLEGIKLADNYVVVFSPYDLSCALQSRGAVECPGYSRDDAAKIATNILFYGLSR